MDEVRHLWVEHITMLKMTARIRRYAAQVLSVHQHLRSKTLIKWVAEITCVQLLCVVLGVKGRIVQNITSQGAHFRHRWPRVLDRPKTKKKRENVKHLIPKCLNLPFCGPFSR